MNNKTIFWVAVSLLAVALAGCGSMQQRGPSWWAGGYDAIVVGQTAGGELLTRFSADTIHTSVGLTYYAKVEWNNEEQAVVVLADPSGQALAKFQVKARKEQTFMGVKRSAEVQGEFTGKILPTVPPGDFAQLIAAIETLRKPQTHPAVRDAHNLVAAGLVRTLELIPGVPVPAGDVQRLAETLDKIPAGGEITLSVIRPAAYRITYTVSQMTNK